MAELNEFGHVERCISALTVSVAELCYVYSAFETTPMPSQLRTAYYANVLAKLSEVSGHIEKAKNMAQEDFRVSCHNQK